MLAVARVEAPANIWLTPAVRVGVSSGMGSAAGTGVRAGAGAAVQKGSGVAAA